MSTRSLNKVLLIGNLTRDPELRYTPQGTAVCTFGMATNRTWTPSEGGERQEEAEFHRIVAWAKLAEICSQILYKGRKVYVEGRLQTRTWTGQDGQERTTTEVVIDSMIALGAPKSGVVESSDDYEAGNQNFGEAAANDTQLDDTQEEEIDSETDETEEADRESSGDEKESKAKDKSKKTSESKEAGSGSEEKKESKKEKVSEDDIPF